MKIKINPQADKLNNSLKVHPAGEMLGEYGLFIFFPKSGILSQTAQAKKTSINATIGIALEDDGIPMVLDVVHDKFKDITKEQFRYSPSFGNLDLRKKWKKEIFRKNPDLNGHISLPIVTSGLTHGLQLAYKLFIGENDKIIIPAPPMFWGNYNLTFEGHSYDTFPLFDGSNFNIKGLEEKLNSEGQKKVVLLNFPNNPAGYSPTVDETDKIVQAIKSAAVAGKNIVVLNDDAYFGLVYENNIYEQSLFGKLADIHERVLAVKIDGATKELYSWGLRVGFLTIASKNLSSELTDIIEDKLGGSVRGTISNVSNPSQFVILKGLEDSKFLSQQQQNRDKIFKRYQLVKQTLQSNEEYKKAFTVIPNNSGYFMCIHLINGSADNVRKTLIEKFDTGVISLGENVLRIAYSSVKTKDIPKLFENIYKATKELA